jgi:carboxymethylenebutenolidase
MCHDDDSRAPAPPVRGEVAAHGGLTLTSADGTVFSAYEATPAGFQAGGAGMIVLPDVRGLHPYYMDLAQRFAEAGIPAVAIDYFGRTAGIGDRDHGFEYLPHVQQTTYAGLRADIEAAAAHLREAARVTSLFTTGFCMGGRTAFLSAGFELGLAGVIGFYGWPTGAARNDTPAPADVAGTLRGPILSIFGGADEGIGPDVRDAWERALTGAGVDHETIVYEGAPHSFFDRKAGEFAAQSSAAWDATLGFVRAHTEVVR